MSVEDQPLNSLSTTQSPAQLVNEAVAGDLYARVRTSDFSFTDGEIRGQLNLQSDTTANGIRTVVLAGPLTSAQVTNNDSDSDATGQATVTITVDGSEVNYSADVSVNGISTSELQSGAIFGASAITIHNADAGVSGPLILSLIHI